MGKAVKEKTIYETINEKMGETVSLPVDKLSMSEYNTRSSCVDINQVEKIAGRIRERGFHPKKAISVNVIRGADGSEVSHRVAAGVHRMEAAKKVELINVPCLLYYDLTDEEECILDRWDNEMDEDHKKAHFLAEAEHFRYLNEVKGWSQRQIMKNKGVSKGKVYNRLNVASIPEEAKKIARGAQHAGHFSERHFEEICKLSDPYIIAICNEIAERGRQANDGETDEDENIIQPMRQSEIKERVKVLLEAQENGEKPPPAAQKKKDKQKKERAKETRALEEIMSIPPAERLEKNIIAEMAYWSAIKSIRRMRLDKCVRWLKLTGLINDLTNTVYIVLRKIEEYDLWYRPSKDEPFFFDKKAYSDPFAILAQEAGVAKEHIKKRTLPELKREGFIDYWNENGVWWFQLSWNKLFEVYCERIYEIPFTEEGLKDMPRDYSGILRPTPMHHIRVENGRIVPWDSKEEDLDERLEEEDGLKATLRNLSPPMKEDGIEYCLKRVKDTEEALKLFEEKKKKGAVEVKNEGAYVLGIVKKGPSKPKGFVTPQEERERKELNKKFGALKKELKKKNLKFFCPKKNRRYEILESDEHGFSITKDDGSYSYVYFEEWMDIKYFE